jgi:hypothetical protein
MQKIQRLTRIAAKQDENGLSLNIRLPHAALCSSCTACGASQRHSSIAVKQVQKQKQRLSRI